jgi:hypothetical protein
MIFQSNGMVKSGSSLFFNYVRDLLYGEVGTGSRVELLEAIRSHRIPGLGSCVHAFTEDTLSELTRISAGRWLVVKAHAARNQCLTEAIEKSELMTAYCIRDPRDCILSGFDSRRRHIASGQDNFLEFTDWDTAIAATRVNCETALDWMSSGLARIIRYDRQLTDPIGLLSEISESLGLSHPTRFLESVIEHHNAHKNIQFNTGKLTRFRQELDETQAKRCREELGDYIRAMGYEV